jgi:8-oxo-dGTP diphosphatase
MPKSEQGVNRQRYQVIPRSLIFITDGDKVLLLKGAAHKRLWANKYNGIGGHIESGEDIYQGALRELKEEAGIEVQPLRLCGSIMIDTGENIGIHLFVFTGIFKGGMLQQSDEGKLEWIALGKILEYPLVEDLKTILPAILKTEVGQMIYAHYSYNDQDEMQINYRVV